MQASKALREFICEIHFRPVFASIRTAVDPSTLCTWKLGKKWKQGRIDGISCSWLAEKQLVPDRPTDGRTSL